MYALKLGNKELFSATQPQQCIYDKAVLNFIIQLKRQFFVASVFKINIVVAHVIVNHFIFFVCPCNWVIAIVPNFVWLWAGAQRKAGGIDGEQNINVGIFGKIFLPPVPFIGG